EAEAGPDTARPRLMPPGPASYGPAFPHAARPLPTEHDHVPGDRHRRIVTDRQLPTPWFPAASSATTRQRYAPARNRSLTATVCFLPVTPAPSETVRTT